MDNLILKNFIHNKELFLSDEQHLETKNIVWANIQPGYVTIITLLSLHSLFIVTFAVIFLSIFVDFQVSF